MIGSALSLCVHHGGLGSRLAQGDADLSFLHGTDLFLAVLVCQRYGLRLRPKPLLDAISEVLLASAHLKKNESTPIALAAAA
jgi:hypothetical protein